jgi:hypothetical protein
LCIAAACTTADDVEFPNDNPEDQPSEPIVHAAAPQPPECPSSELWLPDRCAEGASCSYKYEDDFTCFVRTFICAAAHWWGTTSDCDSPECPWTKPTPSEPCGPDGMECRFQGEYCPWLEAQASCVSGAWIVAEPECGNEPYNGGMGFPPTPEG